jgi:hypothetical protein
MNIGESRKESSRLCQHVLDPILTFQLNGRDQFLLSTQYSTEEGGGHVCVMDTTAQQLQCHE